FSSRRRHTRSKRDWSSDVCSSDLGRQFRLAAAVCVTGAGIVVWRPPFVLPRPALPFGGRRFCNSYQKTQKYRCARNNGCSGIRRSEERRVGKEGRRRGSTTRAREK